MNLIIYIFVSFCIFFFSLIGLFRNRKNVLLVLMSVELMLLAINFSFLTTSSYLDDRFGQIFAIFVLTVASAESSIGLAILIVYYRFHGTIALERVVFING